VLCSRDGLSSRGRMGRREGGREGGRKRWKGGNVHMVVGVSEILCGCVCVRRRKGWREREEGEGAKACSTGLDVLFPSFLPFLWITQNPTQR